MPLTPEQAAEYERAAKALERHRRTPNLGNLGLKAYRMAYEGMNSRNVTVEMVDNRAARLLRECIERKETIDHGR